jgi:hypothetical protein
VKQEFSREPAAAASHGTSGCARTARDILDCLRDEINKSLEAEYADEKAR